MPRGRLRLTLAEMKALLAVDQDFLAAGPGGLAGAARSQDDRGIGRREGRAVCCAPWLPQRLLRSHPGEPGRQAGAPRAAGPRWPLLDRAVRALPALGEGAGSGARRDVRPGRVDPQGQGDHGGAVRPQLLGRGDQCDQHEARRGVGAICRSPPRRGLSLSDPGRPRSPSSGGLRPTRGSGSARPG